MGVSARLLDARFGIPPAREALVLKELKAWDAAVGDEADGRIRAAATLDEAFSAVGFDLSRDGDGIVDGIDFPDQGIDGRFFELGQLFAGIARHVEAGSFIEIALEDEGGVWRWVFDGERCVEGESGGEDDGGVPG